MSVMDGVITSNISASGYDRSACEVGIVHLGFGAFHRAHQAVYIDKYMQETGDLRWGIAAVNLRASESDSFDDVAKEIAHYEGYFLKSISADGQIDYARIRPHIHFEDWAKKPQIAEELLCRESVSLVTITVTESGYYTDPQGNLDLAHPVIAAEVADETKQSVYAYLRSALGKRKAQNGAPLTISCCDNIRQNGVMLRRNLLSYIDAFGDDDLKSWVASNVTFPCSMVDRITPRSPESLSVEMSDIIGDKVISPILCEDYIQWVMSECKLSPMPDLSAAGVTVTSDVDPYEETKIRVLNGGHTALAYMAALEGVQTFDEVMRVPHLREHFNKFETEEVLPAITTDLPFAKDDYQDKTARRFGNQAIGDTVARICADGMAKFSIFIRPTIEGCFALGITPHHAIESIASWYVFAQHVSAKKIPFDYVEPSWDVLSELLGTDDFLTSEHLWGTVPKEYPQFIELLQRAIVEWEEKWPV